jgi:hypothetical protein
MATIWMLRPALSSLAALPTPAAALLAAAATAWAAVAVPEVTQVWAAMMETVEAQQAVGAQRAARGETAELACYCHIRGWLNFLGNSALANVRQRRRRRVADQPADSGSQSRGGKGDLFSNAVSLQPPKNAL